MVKTRFLISHITRFTCEQAKFVIDGDCEYQSRVREDPGNCGRCVRDLATETLGVWVGL